jgi:hypothetical protein
VDTALQLLNAIPAEAWTVLGLFAAALGGRYAWVVRAAQAIVTAARAQHPEDHGAQLDHVHRKHGRRAAAKRAAKIIRARMSEAPPKPPPLPTAEPLEADIEDGDAVPTPVLTEAENAARDDTHPTIPDAGNPPSSYPPGRRGPGEGGHR